MAKALRALIKFYRTGETTRSRGLRHRLGAGQGVAGRHHQRVHRGLPRRARHQGRVGSAGLLRQPGEDDRDPEARRERAVVRGPHAVGSAVPQAGRAGHHRERDRRRRSRPATPVRSRRSASTCRTTRPSASATAASRCRCRTSTRPTTSRRCRRSAASSPGRRRRPSARRSGARSAGELTTNMHEVIGHAFGQGGRAAEGQSADRAEGAVLGARGSARRSRRAVLPARSRSSSSSGSSRAGRSRRDRARRVRGLRAQRARAAAPRPRGHARSKKITCATAR